MTNCKYCKADCCNKGLDHQLKEGCRGYIPMTNADRIRAMSDEEICQMIRESYWCAYIIDKDLMWCDSMPDCGTCLQNWLKQPYKEPTHNEA